MRNTWIVAAAAAGLTAAGFGSAWAQEKQDQAPTAKMQGQDQTGAANNMDKQAPTAKMQGQDQTGAANNMDKQAPSAKMQGQDQTGAANNMDKQAPSAKMQGQDQPGRLTTWTSRALPKARRSQTFPLWVKAKSRTARSARNPECMNTVRRFPAAGSPVSWLRSHWCGIAFSLSGS